MMLSAIFYDFVNACRSIKPVVAVLIFVFCLLTACYVFVNALKKNYNPKDSTKVSSWLFVLALIIFSIGMFFIVIRC